MKRPLAVPVFLGFLGCLLAALPAGPVFGEEGWGENPFLADRGRSKPAAQGEDREEEILLQGILWDPKAPTAIINNRVVSKGDPVGRWRVQEIHKDRVILSDGASTRELASQ